MFKKMLLVLAVAAFSFSLASLAVAQEEEEKGNLSLGIRGNMLNPNTTDEEVEFGAGIMAEYDLTDAVSLEAAVDRLTYCDTELIGLLGGIGAVGLSEEFNATDLSLSLKYNFKDLNDRFVPYVLGGIGMLVNDYSLGGVDNSFESHAGAGLNYLLNESWTLVGEARYIWSEADSDFGDIDLDAFVSTVGLKYRF